MYRLAKQKYHRYEPTERKTDIVGADRRNVLRRLFVKSNSIPVQDL